MTDEQPPRLNTGGRYAYWCTHKAHEERPVRVFVAPEDPVPQCADGHGPMKRQANQPYFGQPVPDAERQS